MTPPPGRRGLLFLVLRRKKTRLSRALILPKVPCSEWWGLGSRARWRDSRVPHGACHRGLLTQ